MIKNEITNESLIQGIGWGPVLYSEIGLSFWGGVDPLTGVVTDRHHPLFGKSISGTILAIPSGRGSCTGSCVLLELILNGLAPAAIVLSQIENILPLGVIAAEEFFGRSIPIIQLQPKSFSQLKNIMYARVENDYIQSCDRDGNSLEGFKEGIPFAHLPNLPLTEKDYEILAGSDGLGSQLAMKIIVRMARIYKCSSLISVTKAHIDACIYIGPGGLSFAQKLCDMGARSVIPTTLNAISVDRKKWRQQGLSKELGEPAEKLAEAYVKMGASPTNTCAPYLLNGAPRFGEYIAWAESNAVVFANSVIGARTMKYPDYLDVCVALTGRAPCSGPYIDELRQPQIVVHIHNVNNVDDSFFPLLGYHIGLLSPNSIPYVKGISHLKPSLDDLKSFGAAFATTSAAPMFHIEGITPEAHLHQNMIDQLPLQDVRPTHLRESWLDLNSSINEDVDLIAIGNPHASLNELGIIAGLCARFMGQRKINMTITSGRDEYEKAVTAGYINIIEKFGANLIIDTCWCMLTEPIIPSNAQVIMTNSGKYAHYAPALVGRSMRFGSLESCIETACGFNPVHQPPKWLS